METKNFSAKVRHRLAQMGMSQAELARRCEMTPQTLHGILKAGKPPRTAILTAMSRVLELSITYLADDRFDVGSGPMPISVQEARILDLARAIGLEVAEERLLKDPAAAPGEFDRFWGGSKIQGGKAPGGGKANGA